MIQHLMRIIIVVFISISQVVLADEAEKKPLSGTQIAAGVALAEGVFAVNSYMASRSPHGYGAIGLLLFPMAGGGSRGSEATKWAALASAEALAIYNLSINENKTSRSEIFKNNMVGWHAFVLVVGTTAYIAGDFKRSPSYSLSLSPTQGAPMLVFSRNF